MKKFEDGFVPVLPPLRSFRLYRRVLEVAWVVHFLPIAGDLKDQMSRASRSAVLNVAEGSGKATLGGRRACWSIARGSVREVSSCVDLAWMALGECEELVRLAGLLVESDRILRKLLG